MNHENERLLADALPAGIVALGQDGKINWWNHIARDLLKLEDLAAAGEHITHIIQSKKFIDFYNHPDDQEIKIQLPVKKDCYLSLRLRPYRKKQQLLIVHDVTHTHRLEVMREDFIANVSHELRTPLTVFSGYLELLHERNNFDEDKFKTMLQHMGEQSERMERLVRDLLLLSRLESHQPNTRHHTMVRVSDLIRTITRDAESLSGNMQHNIQLDIDDNLEMEGHAEELHSAFSNIIFNAVCYTPKKGRILIKWYQDDKGKHFCVSDTGIGIEDEHIPRITQRFYRVDKSRTYKGKGGTGLGLAIVKHVLLRHHGELAIESKINQGSTFICTF